MKVSILEKIKDRVLLSKEESEELLSHIADSTIRMHLQKILIEAIDKLVAALIAGTHESIIHFKEQREKAWKELREHEKDFK